MNLSTKLLLGFVAFATLFLAVVVANYQLSNRVLGISQRVSASQHLTSRGNLYYRTIVDMETGFRGYLITGREEALEPYYEGERGVRDLEEELKRLVATQSVQADRLRRVREQFVKWRRWAQLLISENRALLRQEPTHTGLDGLEHGYLVRDLSLKRMLDDVRQTLREFLATETSTRAAQAKKLSAAINETRTTSILLTVAALALGLMGAFYFTRLLAGRIRRQVGWAERLADGDYGARVEDMAGDELTTLSESLDRMADTITTTIAKLEARNRELDQFAYIISHDLKAPLRGLESVSRWIEEDLEAQQIPPHIQDFLRLMRARVGRMENLINGILALSRVGRVAEISEPVDVGELLRELIEDLASPPGLVIRLPPRLPVLQTNRTALAQVFQNLISNAIKYHDRPQHATVTVTWRATPAHHVFTVADDGPGIAPEYHERIFQIFQTLHARDSVESTGVGLTIVKKIVERHGGTVTVASDEGRGAAFTFTWPLNTEPTDGPHSTP